MEGLTVLTLAPFISYQPGMHIKAGTLNRSKLSRTGYSSWCLFLLQVRKPDHCTMTISTKRAHQTRLNIIGENRRKVLKSPTDSRENSMRRVQILPSLDTGPRTLVLSHFNNKDTGPQLVETGITLPRHKSSQLRMCPIDLERAATSLHWGITDTIRPSVLTITYSIITRVMSLSD